MEFTKLIYHEDFSQIESIDRTHWTLEVGEKWANNESQCYVDDHEHARIENGKLTIEATIHEGETCKYRSARMNSRGKFEYQYGKLIIRAKMPKGRGAWPALWLMGAKKGMIRWPQCGEIDLVEFAGNRPGVITCAIHTQTYNHRKGNDKGTKITVKDASDTFHDYILEWTKEYLSFQIDGKEFFKVEKALGDTEDEWPFDQPYYLILNVAVGGWYGGKIVDEDFPFNMQVESIKIYQ